MAFHSHFCYGPFQDGCFPGAFAGEFPLSFMKEKHLHPVMKGTPHAIVFLPSRVQKTIYDWRQEYCPNGSRNEHCSSVQRKTPHPLRGRRIGVRHHLKRRSPVADQQACTHLSFVCKHTMTQRNTFLFPSISRWHIRRTGPSFAKGNRWISSHWTPDRINLLFTVSRNAGCLLSPLPGGDASPSSQEHWYRNILHHSQEQIHARNTTRKPSA